MPRCFPLIIALLFLAIPSLLWADAFDYYINQNLQLVPEFAGAEKIKELTPELMVQHSRTLPGITATFLVVKTNEGKWCKILAQPARQKVAKDQTVPIFLLERFATYREGEERRIEVEGKNMRLFDGFHFSLDLGQVVPASVGGDIKFVADKDKVALEPVGKAEMYLMTKPMPGVGPKKLAKLVVGATFDPRYFTGVYQMFDDGRRSGKLHLKFESENDVTGWYYSDKDGSKYEVVGKISEPNHAINFRITFPQTYQEFRGWLFTGDGKAIAGSSRLQDRETGFYAVRLESE